MLQFLKMAAALIVLFAWLPAGQAEAACQLITATHSAATKAEAAQTSRSCCAERLSAQKREALELCHVKCSKGQRRSVLEGG